MGCGCLFLSLSLSVLAENLAPLEAPVLLLHGKNETVVPIEQSKIMNRALKKAGKDVTFVQLSAQAIFA